MSEERTKESYPACLISEQRSILNVIHEWAVLLGLEPDTATPDDVDREIRRLIAEHAVFTEHDVQVLDAAVADQRAIAIRAVGLHAASGPRMVAGMESIYEKVRRMAGQQREAIKTH